MFSIVKTSCKFLPSTNQILRSFSSSTRVFSSLKSNKNLSDMLKSEMDHELNSEHHEPELPADLKKYLSSSPFKIVAENISNSNTVSMERDFGNENINVKFDIVPQDNEDEMEYSEEGDEELEPSQLLDVSINITKEGTDENLTFYAVADSENEFFIEDIQFSNQEEGTVEGEYNRKKSYVGPKFHQIDETLQEQFAKYLEERGFDSGLSDFMHQYAQWKEQNEYVDWLKRVKHFVDK
jgi:complement component 1 Q subcomponent-binding protein